MSLDFDAIIPQADDRRTSKGRPAATAPNVRRTLMQYMLLIDTDSTAHLHRLDSAEPAHR